MSAEFLALLQQQQLHFTNVPGTFIDATYKSRMPELVRDCVAMNRERFSDEKRRRLLQLADDMISDAKIPLPSQYPEQAAQSKTSSEWETLLAGKGYTWQNAPWFLSEHYMFHLILLLTEYYSTGIDPFRPSYVVAEGGGAGGGHALETVADGRRPLGSRGTELAKPLRPAQAVHEALSLGEHGRRLQQGREGRSQWRWSVVGLRRRHAACGPQRQSDLVPGAAGPRRWRHQASGRRVHQRQQRHRDAAGPGDGGPPADAQVVRQGHHEREGGADVRVGRDCHRCPRTHHRDAALDAHARGAGSGREARRVRPQRAARDPIGHRLEPLRVLPRAAGGAAHAAGAGGGAGDHQGRPQLPPPAV
ncbi:hypothetical protein ON010_g17854 [Phytophthora cinnamomi]|nr:hypothetical protein ON010_g17854 [Phytophthora cinnamomi]